ncbi:uncharacterized protein LOC135119785 [Zophobas morio]|uniref:uncharacterized protein LOC135119785 n=1 Tax=Zophobas morio TaxID=2755281 RepID=UPI003083D736
MSYNRLVFLYGPPGTGKTTLCKALSQKMAIRSKDNVQCQLIELHSESLMSKYFSESGKLVNRMFEKIQDLIADERTFVFVLIDEIETLVTSRKKLTENEPSDVMRVVNTILTQIDQLRNYSNVMLLTTSNMLISIDCAFIDRADVKFYVGLPSESAIYAILYSCILELIRVNLITSPHKGPPLLLPLDELNEKFQNNSQLKEKRVANSDHLRKISSLCRELSARTIKKLPFMAYVSLLSEISNPIDLEGFLSQLEIATKKEGSSIKILHCS